MTVVNVRLANSAIVVEAADLSGGRDVATVRVSPPNAPELLLLQDEALTLALAIARSLEVGAAHLLAGLLEHENERRAAHARIVRRSPDVDEHFGRVAELY